MGLQVTFNSGRDLDNSPYRNLTDCFTATAFLEYADNFREKIHRVIKIHQQKPTGLFQFFSSNLPKIVSDLHSPRLPKVLADLQEQCQKPFATWEGIKVFNDLLQQVFSDNALRKIFTGEISEFITEKWKFSDGLNRYLSVYENLLQIQIQAPNQYLAIAKEKKRSLEFDFSCIEKGSVTKKSHATVIRKLAADHSQHLSDINNLQAQFKTSVLGIHEYESRFQETKKVMFSFGQTDKDEIAKEDSKEIINVELMLDEISGLKPEFDIEDTIYLIAYLIKNSPLTQTDIFFKELLELADLSDDERKKIIEHFSNYYKKNNKVNTLKDELKELQNQCGKLNDLLSQEISEPDNPIYIQLKNIKAIVKMKEEEVDKLTQLKFTLERKLKMLCVLALIRSFQKTREENKIKLNKFLIDLLEKRTVEKNLRKLEDFFSNYISTLEQQTGIKPTSELQDEIILNKGIEELSEYLKRLYLIRLDWNQCFDKSHLLHLKNDADIFLVKRQILTILIDELKIFESEMNWLYQLKNHQMIGGEEKFIKKEREFVLKDNTGVSLKQWQKICLDSKLREKFHIGNEESVSQGSYSDFASIKSQYNEQGLDIEDTLIAIGLSHNFPKKDTKKFSTSSIVNGIMYYFSNETSILTSMNLESLVEIVNSLIISGSSKMEKKSDSIKAWKKTLENEYIAGIQDLCKKYGNLLNVVDREYQKDNENEILEVTPEDQRFIDNLIVVIKDADQSHANKYMTAMIR